VQEFVTCGREFQQYQDEWMKRVEKFEKEGLPLGESAGPEKEA